MKKKGKFCGLIAAVCFSLMTVGAICAGQAWWVWLLGAVAACFSWINFYLLQQWSMEDNLWAAVSWLIVALVGANLSWFFGWQGHLFPIPHGLPWTAYVAEAVGWLALGLMIYHLVRLRQAWKRKRNPTADEQSDN